jgi:anti-sigma factor ChrR (cupin superfamily)
MTATPLELPDLASRVLDPAFPWSPFRPGIEIHRLAGQGDRGPASAILRYAPGASVPRHRHPGYEHILVLHGAQVDERGRHGAGCLVINPPGSEHAVHCPEGSIVLVLWEHPVVFAGESSR